jgi:glycosyltransferase involved in cell wall biosynthesis
MKVKKIVVTGEQYYIQRRQFLFKAMSPYFEEIQFNPRSPEWYDAKIPRLLLKYLYALRVFSLSKADTLYQRNKREFIAKSRRAEREIKQLDYTPDLIFHIFNTYSPLWDSFDIPYVIYLDYTMVLAEKSGSPWVYFISRKERDARFECERQMYDRSYHLFAMSSLVKNSLIEDYRINPEKITVVGVSGNFKEPYEGEKTFGTKQILFNGSDFERKGGDIVLAAFEEVRKALPEAKLVVIGKTISTTIDGVENPGKISSRSELEELFLKTDLVVAPSRYEPFGLFLVEAMSYGIPCIVSAHEGNGILEFLDHEVDSILIPEPTPDVLARHTINLLSNPSLLASMSEAARCKVKSKLNWNTIAKEMVQVLSQLT